MGQRHQAFLIARVIPHGANVARYRCIAAIHHQWCLGTLPLRAVRRFLDLVKVPQNAEIVSEEIKYLNGKYGAKMDDQPMIPDVPCPYTHLLLCNAFSVDAEDPENRYISHASPLRASMGCFDGDHEDGITVIDITDPLLPAYALITYHDYPVRETALSYVRQYYPEGEDHGMDEDIIRTVVNKLKGEKYVTLDVLREAWPREYSGKVVVINDEEFNEPTDACSTEAQGSVPTLVDLTIESALRHALQEGSVMELEHFVETPSTATIMKDCLRKEVPFTFGVAHLMSLLVEREAHSPESIVDLSAFSACTTENFLAMLPPSVHAIDTLILSHNPQLTSGTVQAILEKLPKIRRLVLFHTGIDNEDLRSLLSSRPRLFYHIESVVHPLCLLDPGVPNPQFCLFNDSSSSLTSVPPRPAPRYPYQFTYLVAYNSYSQTYTAATSLATFTLSKIVQVLIDFLAQMPYAGLYGNKLVSYEVAMKGNFGSESRRGERWGKRVIGMVPDSSMQYIEHPDHGDGWVFSIWYIEQNVSPLERTEESMPENPCLGFFRRRRRDNDEEVQPQAEKGDGKKWFSSKGEFVYESHTLQGFLSRCENDGRTLAPSEDVLRLQGILDRLMSTENQEESREESQEESQDVWTQMTTETFETLIEMTYPEESLVETLDNCD